MKKNQDANPVRYVITGIVMFFVAVVDREIRKANSPYGDFNFSWNTPLLDQVSWIGKAALLVFMSLLVVALFKYLILPGLRWLISLVK